MKKYKSPSGLSNIQEKDLEYSQMIQPTDPTQASIHNSGYGKNDVNPFSSSPQGSHYNSASPNKFKSSEKSRSRSPEQSYVSLPRTSTVNIIENTSPVSPGRKSYVKPSGAAFGSKSAIQ